MLSKETRFQLGKVTYTDVPSNIESYQEISILGIKYDSVARLAIMMAKFISKMEAEVNSLTTTIYALYPVEDRLFIMYNANYDPTAIPDASAFEGGVSLVKLSMSYQPWKDSFVVRGIRTEKQVEARYFNRIHDGKRKISGIKHFNAIDTVLKINHTGNFFEDVKNIYEIIEKHHLDQLSQVLDLNI